MAGEVTHKDINLLSQKAAVAGTEKLPVSDTEYITPAQISGLGPWESGTGTNSVKIKNAEGSADGNHSTVEGKGCVTGGNYTENTLVVDTADTSNGAYSHAEGRYTIANGNYGAHAEGNKTLASGGAAHAEGNNTVASALYCHAEGTRSVASGPASHAEGRYSRAEGNGAHAEGIPGFAIGNGSHAESMSQALGVGSHAECGNFFHPISLTGGADATQYTATSTEQELLDIYSTVGNSRFTSILAKAYIAKSGKIDSTATKITQVTSVSFNNNTLSFAFVLEKTISSTALNDDSTYRLNLTMAYGGVSHSECAVSWGQWSHAEGMLTAAFGDQSHTEGQFTTTNNVSEHAEGQYNVSHKASDTYGNAGNTQHSIGIGSSAARLNAVEVMQNGDVYIKGIGGYNGSTLSGSTLQQVLAQTALPALTGDDYGRFLMVRWNSSTGRMEWSKESALRDVSAGLETEFNRSLFIPGSYGTVSINGWDSVYAGINYSGGSDWSWLSYGIGNNRRTLQDTIGDIETLLAAL